MALNTIFDGYVYDKDSVIGDTDIYYQAYFYSNSTASSTSTWNDVRSCEASGYYNINLGDADWLGQDGTALSGSKVVIVFWKGGPDRTSDCSVLTEWGAFELDIDGSSVYSNNTQTMDNIDPNVSWTVDISRSAYVNNVYTVTNNSDDEHSWVFGTTTMNHWYSKYSQIINGPNFIDHTDYYWGDGESTLNQSGTTNASHIWDSAGPYVITVEVFDDCNDSSSSTFSFTMYWNTPVPNIVMTPSDPLPNEPVSFSYTGTDIDDNITSIEWTIEDEGDYGNTNTTISGGRDDTISHVNGQGTDWCGESAVSEAYTNPGSHLVSIIVSWYGFTTQTISYSKTFNQGVFSAPTVDFTQVPALTTLSSGIEFVNASTNTSRVGTGLPECEEYGWTWTVDETSTEYNDKPYIYDLEVTTDSVNSQVKLCANYSDGWVTQETCVEKDVVFDATVTITEEDCFFNLNLIGTSSDGSVNGYSWVVASGISDTGPWYDTWTSPTDIGQNDKKICFTAVGWYNITGYIHGTGTTTYDSEALYINVVCSAVSVPICAPDMYGEEFGKKTSLAQELKPTIRVFSPPSVS